MTQPAAPATRFWLLVVGLGLGLFAVSLPALVLGLLLNQLWLVYLSIAASVLAVPAWVAAAVLLLVRSRRPAQLTC